MTQMMVIPMSTFTMRSRFITSCEVTLSSAPVGLSLIHISQSVGAQRVEETGADLQTEGVDEDDAQKGFCGLPRFVPLLTQF